MIVRFKLLLGVAILFAAPLPALAAAPLSGVEQAGTKVDDSALGDMRGKFILPGNVSYFGIQMQSSWQRPDGVTTAATLLLNVDFSGGAAGPPAHLPVSWNRDGDGQMDVAGFGPAAAGTYVTVPIGAGGLGTVHGAVPRPQRAGSDN